MTIGQLIIKKLPLSVEQANRVFNDLTELDTKGVWRAPYWATELSDHYGDCGIAHIVVQIRAWKAVAEAYKKFKEDLVI